MNSIGTYQETSLHASLKGWYAQSGDLLETQVGNYTVDILHGDVIIEIQTGNFAKIKRKLAHLLEDHPIRLVYPIALEKWIIRQESTGLPLTRRHSPKHGRLEDLYSELVFIPRLVTHPNFSLEVVFTKEEDIRINDGKGSWRRKGWSIADHRLVEIVATHHFTCPNDYLKSIPPDLPQPFTTRQLAERLRLRRHISQKMTYCLREMGAIQRAGNQGNAPLYQRADVSAPKHSVTIL